MRRVEHIRRPLKVGEWLLVPCITRIERVDKTEDELWLDHSPDAHSVVHEYCPIVNLPHDDIESGQKEKHYHIDDRFDRVGDWEIRLPIQKLTYKALQVKRTEILSRTSVGLIKHSRLDHECLKRNRCPHKGYDLSQVQEVNGRKLCPLHGLEMRKYKGQWYVELDQFRDQRAR